MRCPKCGTDNKQGRKFCSKCGTKLENVCPECGFRNDPDDDFCGGCGAKLVEAIPMGKIPHTPGRSATEIAVPRLEDMHTQLQSLIPDELARKYMAAEQEATGENRPITALFADISGFTPLSNTQSSEAVFQLVQDCFKQLVGIVARYEGSISGFRGDGLLALFGAPILHENDAERAIFAAIDMRDAMQEQRLEVSIGINTAMMTVGEIQTQLHKEYTAYGTDVNLAKRLQEAAEPGQILVGAGTHRLTRRAFDFETLTSLSLKGFAQPVTAYSMQQVKVHPEKLRGIEGLRARMIGREHEFVELKDAADQWLKGQGQIVSIIGEAGIGKSRLVRELREYLDMRLETPDMRQESLKSHVSSLMSILEGRCVSIGQPISYWPFMDILRTYFALSEEDGDAAKARKVTEATEHLLADRAAEVLPFLGNLLSMRFGNELDDRLKFVTPEQIRHQTMMRLRDFFETLARKQPLLLILEDLHWADDLSLDLLTLLMDSLAMAPLMLLCVYRPEREHRVWQLSSQAQRKCLDRYTEIALNALSSRESRQLVETLLAIENLPGSVKEMILQKSEGNPFFIEEVIRSLIEQDLVYREGDRWKARSEISDINVPGAIQSVLLARVDRLRAEAKYVLQCASVIGRLFKYRLLEHLTRQERDLDRYLNEFEERELIYEERTVPELEYAFKHALTQETTYQSILERHRREFHHQVADAIERLYQERLDEYYDELAYHYSRSADTDKAVEYMLKAGEKAEKSFANQVALRYFKDALVCLSELGEEKTEWRITALEGLGRTHAFLGEHDEAIAAFQDALAIRKERRDAPQSLARLYRDIARSLERQERRREAIQIAREGLRLRGDTVCVERALLYQFLALTLAYLETFEDTKEREEVEIYTKKCWELLQQLAAEKEYFPEFASLWSIVAYYSPLWTDEQMIAHYEEGIRRSRKHGDKWSIMTFCHRLGDTHFIKSGDLKQALKWYQRYIEHAREIGNQNSLMFALIDTGALLTRESETLQESEQCLQEGLKLAEAIGTQHYVHIAKMCLGLVYAGTQRWSEVLETIPPLVEELVRSEMPFGAFSKLEFSQCLMLLEKVWSETGTPEAFPAFCEKLQSQYPD
jgi:class 3 adenylate cyclase/tetratricopeptide (TPR) repeat protein